MSIPELTGENPAGRTIVSSACASDFCRIISNLKSANYAQKICERVHVVQNWNRRRDNDRDERHRFDAEFVARFSPKILAADIAER
jgi:hypothetical protein